LAYTTDDGDTWTVIATNEDNDGSYDWTAPSIDSQSVIVRIVAADDAGNYSFDTSDAYFTIDSTKPVVSTGYATPNPSSGTVNITIVFTENGAGMDTGVDAVIEVTDANDDLRPLTTGSRTDENTWVGVFDVSVCTE
jgi:hypothetical protein